MATEDGGQSWKLQASFPNEVRIEEICFINANEGFAVGAQVIDRRPQTYDELLVLKTSNGGNEWNNISEPAKAAINNQHGIANDPGSYIHLSSSSVNLLTVGGKIIRTTDGGKTWTFIASFKDERPQGFVSSTGYIKLVSDPAQKIRVVAGGRGDEGYWGDFVIHEDGVWTSYEIDLTPIFDAMFLSDREVLACGLSVEISGDNSKRPADGGVILRSFDGGKSWQSIYRTKIFETFFFLTKVNDHEFYAVSDTGTFLRFTLPQ
jgi:photosystem II stability/assembly factor-like uncharacterized protein